MRSSSKPKTGIYPHLSTDRAGRGRGGNSVCANASVDVRRFVEIKKETDDMRDVLRNYCRIEGNGKEKDCCDDWELCSL
jgi:hypothetical protein